MVKRDPMREYAEALNPGFKCKFCGFVSKGSITRMKDHWARSEGKGVTICENVPSHVFKQARKANSMSVPEANLIIGGDNRKRKTMSDSNIDEARNAPSTSLQIPEFLEDTRDTERIQTAEVFGVPEVGRQMDTVTENLMQSVDGDANEIMGDGFLPKNLEGKGFQENMEKILSLFARDDVFSIGIHGIGGVGKTELMMQVCNKLLQNPNTTSKVYWVTVFPNSSLQKLQNAIARAVGLDFSDEDNENKRAVKLLKALRNKKFVLILDDMWDYIPLEGVGIPLAMNGCKLVLTTRSLTVCQMTQCHEIIKVDTLFVEEAWNLFKENLGHKTTLDPEAERIAKSMAGECDGLPLGIISMSSSMRSITDISEWRNALTELRGHIPRQDNMEIFQRLRLSYDCLNDSSLQQCFLYCALFPNCDRDDLIEFLIDEEIIEGMGSRKAEFDKGITMLNTLARVSLLKICDNSLSVTMNHLIRDMAIKILSLNCTVMIENNKQLEEVPNEGKWTEYLMQVSLMGNGIKEIPFNHSLRCSNLSTLFLNNNLNLRFIADSFFKQLYGLKVINLSNTCIEFLPSSISDLVNLRSLLLNRCEKLSNVPSLAKLKLLRRLDLSFSGVQKVEGIDCLTNLRYLDLYRTKVELPAGMLPKLSNLQFLRVGSDEIVIGEELACLKKLEALSCCFNNVENFEIYVQSMKKQKRHGLRIDKEVDDYFPGEYKIHVGKDMVEDDDSSVSFYRHVIFTNCKINREGAEESQLILPENIERLDIINCRGKGILWLDNATQLKHLYFSRLHGIIFLLPCVSPAMFQKLKTLVLKGLKILHALFSAPPTITPFPANGTFSCLERLEISGCPNIIKLFPAGLLPNLRNLEKIEVDDCEIMEEIIASEEQVHQQFSLPNLTHLILSDLPELKSICSGQMICDSMEEFSVYECVKLINPHVHKNGKIFYAKEESVFVTVYDWS